MDMNEQNPSSGGDNCGQDERGSGYSNGGYSNDGYNNGGYNNSGYNNSGYNNSGYNNGGYNNGNDNYGGNPRYGYTRPRDNAMATASVVLGIIGILTFSTGVIPVILGALSVIFFLLSDYRTSGKGFSKYLGLILGIVSIAIGAAMIITTLTQLPTLLQDPTYHKELNDMFKQIYGTDFDSYWKTYMNQF